jgi:hypothetical protein
MPQPAGAAPKAPVNLQGIWNLDRRPAWDCDDHLDLNVQMCYWGLDAMFLGELMEPLMDWVTRLIPQGLRDTGDWEGGRLTHASILSTLGGICLVMVLGKPEGAKTSCHGKDIPIERNGDVPSFQTTKEAIYELVPI